MTIDEAIKCIQYDIEGGYYEEGSQLLKAARLLIEAGKAWKWMREHPGMSFAYYLPGETE